MTLRFYRQTFYKCAITDKYEEIDGEIVLEH